jgi:hypothetical protein
MGKKKPSATTMATDIIELPEPVATPIGRPEDPLKKELQVNKARWGKRKKWSLDEALKLLVGIDPDKFDPRSNIHQFYLKTLNVEIFEQELTVDHGGPLPAFGEKEFWLGLLSDDELEKHELYGLLSKVMVSAAEPTPTEPGNTRKKFSDEQALEAYEKYMKGRDTYPKVTLQSLADEIAHKNNLSGLSYQSLRKRWKELKLEW